MKKTIIICDICRQEKHNTNNILIGTLILSAPILGVSVDFKLTNNIDACTICYDTLANKLRSLIRK